MATADGSEVCASSGDEVDMLWYGEVAESEAETDAEGRR